MENCQAYMDIAEESEDIVGRIGIGIHTPADLERLKQIIVASGSRSVATHNANGAVITTGDGNQIINIVFQGDGFRTEDGTYSNGAEVLRSLLESISPPKVKIDWQQSSRTLLAEQLQLTTNPLTSGRDISYKVEDVYVPLGLLERKKQPTQRQDITPENGSDLGREMGIDRSTNPKDREVQVEITKRFEHDEFLNEVFRDGQSPKSQGKRIAIIGEPGAGKTTLLQQIARWIGKTFPFAIVIWVSLGDLKQEEDLETYLEEKCLKSLVNRAGLADVSTAMKDDFFTHVQKGDLWLLLDGLDEMQGSNPLSAIQRQIQAGGWLQQMRIVMTCRLNLWDGNRNGLETFDTYRTLEFAYPEQVEMFIAKWFAPRESIENGKKLCKALQAAGNERIRDLMKNPLRLSLMCFSWFLKRGKLPETQAELYKRFVDRIYDWKDEKFPTTSEQRRQLNQKLAKLSKAAIDDGNEQGQGRFRLRQKFVKKHLDVPINGEGETFFDLADRLGWLNRVGLDADDLEQQIYAFFHPTFQEYFAALGINDDRFFLTLVPKDPLDPSASYRVFEPQWRQVFLLWLGREDLDKLRKEALIQTLLKFKDRCGDFYTDRAFLLAAVGIAEFKTCSRGDEIVNKLVQWKFPSPDWFSSWARFKKRGREAARGEWATNTFSRTDSQRVIRSIFQVLKKPQYDDIRQSAAASLGKIDPETAIQALVRVLETTQHDSTRKSAAASLGEIGMGNETAIQALVRVLETTQDYSTRQRVAESLGKIDPGNETAIQALVRVLETTQDDILWRAAEILGEIGSGNETAIQALVRVLETTQDYSTRWRAAEILGKIGIGDETAIQALVGVLETTQDDIRWRAAEILGKIDPGNETAIQALVRVLETTQDDIRWRAAESLGKIDPGNETAIQALVRVLETTQDYSTRWRAAEILGKIDPGNETAIQALVRVLETTQDYSTRWRAAEILGEIGSGNETAIKGLVSVLEITQDEFTRWRAAASLGKIGIGDETAIKRLVRSLRRNLRHEESNILMMKFADSLSYRDFYRAFHASR
jgi:HEAT repeat protein/energy-coupling factor transporter ATP-binding protein EcfA2